MIGDYRGESSNENREKQLHLRTPRLYQREKRDKKNRECQKIFVNCDEIDSAREGDRGGRLPTG